MLSFANKFFFSDNGYLYEVCKVTMGATVLRNGFEAACDAADVSLLENLGGEAVPISKNLLVRVTARDEAQRAYWAWRLLAAIGADATLDTTQQGYWGPTDEYESSWLISTTLPAPTAELLEVVYEWLVTAQQEAVYLEFGGQVLILDRDEVPVYATA